LEEVGIVGGKGGCGEEDKEKKEREKINEKMEV
jgi:hypothetical protein